LIKYYETVSWNTAERNQTVEKEEDKSKSTWDKSEIKMRVGLAQHSTQTKGNKLYAKENTC